MAASLALKRATNAPAGNLFNKLLHPFRCVSATPWAARCPRCFSTDSSESQVTAYDDKNRSVDVDRRPGSSVARRPDQDFFTDLLDPFSPTRSLSQIFNMMDQFMNAPFSPEGGLGARRGWDAKEDKESLSLRFDMPGLDKDEVKISIEQNTLIIRGEGQKDSEEEEAAPRRYFSRIYMPPNIYKLEDIKAELKNGVLKIRIPKVKEEERKDVRHVPIE